MISVFALSLAAIPLDNVFQLASGPLVDAQCNMETVEDANVHQLYALLSELSEATFFRLIHVNMDGKCPYWGGSEEEEHACESKAEDTAVPLCTVGNADESNPFSSASPFGVSPSLPMMPAGDFVDQTITPEEDKAIASVAESDCSNDELPTFWLDMCSAIPTNSSDYVNLQLNKESYTGYNVRASAARLFLSASVLERAASAPVSCRARMCGRPSTRRTVYCGLEVTTTTCATKCARLTPRPRSDDRSIASRCRAL